MTGITSAISRRLRLLLPAALIAAAATLGGNALPDTPTAYAEPKKPFHKDGYYACLNQAIEEKKKGNISGNHAGSVMDLAEAVTRQEKREQRPAGIQFRRSATQISMTVGTIIGWRR